MGVDDRVGTHTNLAGVYAFDENLHTAIEPVTLHFVSIDKTMWALLPTH